MSATPPASEPPAPRTPPPFGGLADVVLAAQGRAPALWEVILQQNTKKLSDDGTMVVSDEPAAQTAPAAAATGPDDAPAPAEGEAPSDPTRTAPTNEGSADATSDAVAVSVRARGMLLNIKKWADTARQTSQESLYKSIRRQYLHAIVEGRVYTTVTTSKKDLVPIWQQAEQDVNTDKAIAERVRLKSTPEITNLVSVLWHRLPRDGEGLLHRGAYAALCAGVFMQLVPGGFAEDCAAVVADDWNRDTKGKGVMTEGQFTTAMFELVDVWCPTISLEDYLEFLRRVVVPAALRVGGVVTDPLAEEYDFTDILPSKPKAPTPPPAATTSKAKLRPAPRVTATQSSKAKDRDAVAAKEKPGPASPAGTTTNSSVAAKGDNRPARKQMAEFAAFSGPTEGLAEHPFTESLNTSHKSASGVGDTMATSTDGRGGGEQRGGGSQGSDGSRRALAGRRRSMVNAQHRASISGPLNTPVSFKRMKSNTRTASLDSQPNAEASDTAAEAAGSDTASAQGTAQGVPLHRQRKSLGELQAGLRLTVNVFVLDTTGDTDAATDAHLQRPHMLHILNEVKVALHTHLARNQARQGTTEDDPDLPPVVWLAPQALALPGTTAPPATTPSHTPEPTSQPPTDSSVQSTTEYLAAQRCGVHVHIREEDLVGTDYTILPIPDVEAGEGPTPRAMAPQVVIRPLLVSTRSRADLDALLATLQEEEGRLLAAREGLAAASADEDGATASGPLSDMMTHTVVLCEHDALRGPRSDAPKTNDVAPSGGTEDTAPPGDTVLPDPTDDTAPVLARAGSLNHLFHTLLTDGAAVRVVDMLRRAAKASTIQCGVPMPLTPPSATVTVEADVAPPATVEVGEHAKAAAAEEEEGHGGAGVAVVVMEPTVVTTPTHTDLPSAPQTPPTSTALDATDIVGPDPVTAVVVGDGAGDAPQGGAAEVPTPETQRSPARSPQDAPMVQDDTIVPCDTVAPSGTLAMAETSQTSVVGPSAPGTPQSPSIAADAEQDAPGEEPPDQGNGSTAAGDLARVGTMAPSHRIKAHGGDNTVPNTTTALAQAGTSLPEFAPIEFGSDLVGTTTTRVADVPPDPNIEWVAPTASHPQDTTTKVRKPKQPAPPSREPLPPEQITATEPAARMTAHRLAIGRKLKAYPSIHEKRDRTPHGGMKYVMRAPQIPEAPSRVRAALRQSAKPKPPLLLMPIPGADELPPAHLARVLERHAQCGGGVKRTVQGPWSVDVMPGDTMPILVADVRELDEDTKKQQPAGMVPQLPSSIAARTVKEYMPYDLPFLEHTVLHPPHPPVAPEPVPRALPFGGFGNLEIAICSDPKRNANAIRTLTTAAASGKVNPTGAASTALPSTWGSAVARLQDTSKAGLTLSSQLTPAPPSLASSNHPNRPGAVAEAKKNPFGATVTTKPWTRPLHRTQDQLHLADANAETAALAFAESTRKLRRLQVETGVGESDDHGGSDVEPPPAPVPKPPTVRVVLPASHPVSQSLQPTMSETTAPHPPTFSSVTIAGGGVVPPSSGIDLDERVRMAWRKEAPRRASPSELAAIEAGEVARETHPRGRRGDRTERRQGQARLALAISHTPSSSTTGIGQGGTTTSRQQR